MDERLIYQPIKPYHVNQSFGGNSICISTDGNSKIIGCDGTNPPQGYRSLYGAKGHLGLDLRAYHGQELVCAQRGRVVHIDTQERSGLDVRIESEINGIKFLHIYEHMLGYSVQVGDWVDTGQLIGWADNTGYSSGDHLHFEVRDMNGVSMDPDKIMYPTYAKNILAINNTLKYVKQQLASIAVKMARFLRK